MKSILTLITHGSRQIAQKRDLIQGCEAGQRLLNPATGHVSLIGSGWLRQTDC
jgi:hypothetical protein